jgi:alpha-ketoglutarate-dependent taurine dioxygenase
MVILGTAYEYRSPGRESRALAVDRTTEKTGVGMTTLTLNDLTETIGAEVLGLDADRIANDESVPGAIAAALEEHGVLVFPKLGLEPSEQVAFCERLGKVETQHNRTRIIDGVEGVTRLGYSSNPGGDHTRFSFLWHFDGARLPIEEPIDKYIFLTARNVGGADGTEFVSTYHAYELLTEEEKERFAGLRVMHSAEMAYALMTAEPTAEQKAERESEAARMTGAAGKEWPLVWQHRSGRRSLVIGASARQVLGMEETASRALLDELVERSTAPSNVYRHMWSKGDSVIWDNHGVLHRALPYEPGSPRDIQRSTMFNDEVVI